MGMRFFIVDDDAGSRRMLQVIIEDSELGDVVGTANSGLESVSPILTLQPDVVLIDLLMPDQDGIETMELLHQRGFNGAFIMISQVVNKEMVGEAYRKGVEFFIHKPINRIEVESLLYKMKENIHMKRSLQAIKQSLSGISEPPRARQELSIKDIVLTILNDMGIGGESGSSDLVRIMEILVEYHPTDSFPPLKDLYESAARTQKEIKAMEQRIRRAILTALNNLASIGLTDYANPKFEHYATRFFEFGDVRARMRDLEEDMDHGKAKVNIKKFIQVLYFETLERMKR
jgi:two-component system, response regulator YcbB